MRVPFRGLTPLRPKFVRLARILAFGLIGAGFSGCATQQPPSYAGVYQPVAERPWKTEVEDDGRPAQVPPVRRARPEEDDPSQPWSPNYGKGSPKGQTAPVPPARQANMPPLIDTSAVASSDVSSVRERPARVLSTAEADSVLLRAIQNHESRRP
jgi:hypothetical protein